MIYVFNLGYRCSLKWPVTKKPSRCHIYHTTSYHSYDYRLDYRRADGIPYFPVSMAVCA
jgi:hypothetical protein